MSRCPRCGSEERRSNPQNNRYHALMRAAFHHWPLAHAFQPRNPEHLRKWLQVRAGFKVVKMVSAPKGFTASALRDFVWALFNASSDHVFATVIYHEITHEVVGVELHISKSTRFEKLGHRDACRLMNAVEDIIKSELGLEAEQLLKHTEQAA